VEVVAMATLKIINEEVFKKVSDFSHTVEVERRTLLECLRFLQDSWGDCTVEIVGGLALPEHSLGFLVRDPNGYCRFDGGVCYFKGEGWSLHS
jgi:hypothetical protein